GIKAKLSNGSLPLLTESQPPAVSKHNLRTSEITLLIKKGLLAFINIYFSVIPLIKKLVTCFFKRSHNLQSIRIVIKKVSYFKSSLSAAANSSYIRADA